MTPLESLFYFYHGLGAYREQLETGTTPLVSATNTNNGIITHVDFTPTFKAPAITVERVTGNAFVQLFDFATVPDDISVLVPKQKMSLNELFFIASQINLRKWKFSYSRKATPKRLKEILIDLSKFDNKLSKTINFKKFLPPSKPKQKLKHNKKTKEFLLNELFDEVGKGDYHVSSELSTGSTPFISCVTVNNGVLGLYDLSEKKLYKNAITIACDGDRPLTPFYHPYEFNAQDNVMIYKPKKDTLLSTIFYILAELRRERWRFSYGRKCYLNKLRKIKIKLPVTNDEKLDVRYMEQVAENAYGWSAVKNVLMN